MHVTGADHTSFTVSSLERSLAFYAGLLGFEVLWVREISNEYFRAIVGWPGCVVKAAQLRIPSSEHRLELFEYVEPRAAGVEIPTNQPGSAHLALRVSDLPAAYEELKAQSVHFRSAPVLIDAGVNRGGYAVYALDPDGFPIELFQPPAPAEAA